MDVRRDGSPLEAAPLQAAAVPPPPTPTPGAALSGGTLPAEGSPPRQAQRGAAEAAVGVGPAAPASMKRVHSPANGGAVAKLPRLERAAAAGPNALPGAPVAAGAAAVAVAGVPRGELQAAAVVRSVTQALLAKMLQVGVATCRCAFNLTVSCDPQPAG